jgi:hypothetical protein
MMLPRQLNLTRIIKIVVAEGPADYVRYKTGS